ncbi:MAG: hypothetical protein R2909_19040 [Gemmatimonadales bacterium]
MGSSSRNRILRVALAAVVLMVAGLPGGSLHAQSKPKLSAEEIARLMDNPVGELIQLPIQYDRLSVRSPQGDDARAVTTVKVIPTFPLGRGRWRLVNRLVVPHVGLPDSPLGDGPSGFGDLTYVGALTPSSSSDLGRGKLIWAVGPTLVLPTAGEGSLGQGKYQLGPAAAVAYLGPRLTLGLFGQHWWSVAGDAARASVSQTNLQYFWYLRLPEQWAIGASPSITIDWKAAGGTAVDVPLGIGLNKTLFLGPLPARVAAEVTRHVITSGDGPEPTWGFRLSVTPVIPAFILRGR